jgi:hypothetical protein
MRSRATPTPLQNKIEKKSPKKVKRSQNNKIRKKKLNEL